MASGIEGLDQVRLLLCRRTSATAASGYQSDSGSRWNPVGRDHLDLMAEAAEVMDRGFVGVHEAADERRPRIGRDQNPHALARCWCGPLPGRKTVFELERDVPRPTGAAAERIVASPPEWG